MSGLDVFRDFFRSLLPSKCPRRPMAEHVTIRNISNVPLELKLVEHFDPGKDRFDISDIARGFSAITNTLGLTNNITRADVPQITPADKPFATRQVSIPISPFEAVKTDIKPIINHPKERLRLTFVTQMGGHHRMYCPVPTAESEVLECLAPNPRVRFTGVYLTDEAYATLFSSSNLPAWMRELPDETPLGALSIPGTHDSPTCHQAPPSVRCQAVSPLEQLRNGVRFFDLRVQVPTPFNPESDKLLLVHAVFPISLTGPKYFRDLYNDMLQFLQENPSETIIASLKREGTGDGTDQQLSQILKRHYTNPRQWFTEPRVPKLGEVRGRITMLRRFVLDPPLRNEWGGRGWGIDAHNWADNTPYSVCPPGDVVIQDFYEVMEESTINQKITYARNQLEKSGTCAFQDTVSAQGGQPSKVPLYINFLSASNFWKLGTWPEKIAAKVNPAIVEWLCSHHMLDNQGRVKQGDWSTGIVVTDWVGVDGDYDLWRAIVGFNAKLIP